VTGSPRDAIFSRLRSAGRGALPEEIRRDLRALGTAPAAELPDPDLCTAFLTNVLKNQGSADCARDAGETVQAVADYLYRHLHSHKLVAGNDPGIAALPWRDAGVLVRFGAVDRAEPAALSYAPLGVAELGAVVLLSGRANPAVNNLLPEHHIVLVNGDSLVPRAEQAWERINGMLASSGRPRGINFIAGPSSTADIEGQLVYGVHGPRRWHVILVGADVPEGALERARELAGG
jgi:L-lactate dehydrogenase complex protein LldG